MSKVSPAVAAGISLAAFQRIRSLLRCHIASLNQRGSSNVKVADEDHMARLAKQIDGDFKKDEYLRLREADITELRREGASQLHAIWADFVRRG